MKSNKLCKWFEIYIKHKDIFKKEIKEIMEDKNNLKITYKKESNKKEELVFCSHVIKEELLNKLKKDKSYYIILENRRENIMNVVKNWDKIKDIKKLKIIFVNIRSNAKWILSPHVHNKVSDINGHNNLEESLLGLSELVPFLDGD